MKTIAVLITVHNRKNKTLQCLTHLFDQQAVEGYQLEVYLTDDGCTDGTVQAVTNQYPSVQIVQGDGTLFWNRGMHRAWQAASQTKDYDFYLWLNDDTVLFADAMKNILTASKQTYFSAIVCGATCAKATQLVTYSGWLHSSKKLLAPNGKLQQCNIVNGNFVLVPKVVFDKVGNLDWKFRHAIGDFDYGLRAQKAGFKCFIAPQFVGTCEANPTLPKWCLKTTSLIKRLKLLYSPLGYAEPIPFFIYEKRHFGLLIALKHFFSIHLRVLLPHLWK
ncbi:glycosyltransferase family 2 protein [Runella sp. SP2]|uniref:glycosyltransferase family 2 protein n=1 Tax=Runella sp. SP2 TaxID=2268026 RepID=UPI000F07D8E4|nr:glycosyltransferase family 2 protein [Runella sp. SP2]AYQ31763.1 glycosyltransferase family 2 protein [Runella sp. SP2]